MNNQTQIPDTCDSELNEKFADFFFLTKNALLMQYFNSFARKI